MKIVIQNEDWIRQRIEIVMNSRNHLTEELRSLEKKLEVISDIKEVGWLD